MKDWEAAYYERDWQHDDKDDPCSILVDKRRLFFYGGAASSSFLSLSISHHCVEAVLKKKRSRKEKPHKYSTRRYAKLLQPYVPVVPYSLSYSVH